MIGSIRNVCQKHSFHPFRARIKICRFFTKIIFFIVSKPKAVPINIAVFLYTTAIARIRSSHRITKISVLMTPFGRFSVLQVRKLLSALIASPHTNPITPENNTDSSIFLPFLPLLIFYSLYSVRLFSSYFTSPPVPVHQGQWDFPSALSVQ